MRSIRDKRGITPIIATMLLVAIVIVMVLIIFLWFRSFGREAITKFNGQNVEVLCGNLDFDASYSSGTLQISNNGNIPIFDFKIKESGFSSNTRDLSGISGAGFTGGLSAGKSFSGPVDISTGKFKVIPMLLGDSDSGKKLFTCPDGNGIDVTVN